MRPRHWWGAAIGAGLLASATFVAPAALAAPASPSSVVASHSTAHSGVAARKSPVATGRVVKKGRVVAKHRPRTRPGRPGNHHHHPHYPPHATPSVEITLPPRARIGRNMTVTAKVSINSTPVVGAAAGLYGSIDGGMTWKLYTTTNTGGDGSVGFSYTPRHKVTLRIVVASGSGYAAAQSAAVPLNLH